jgi:hypothetical protein
VKVPRAALLVCGALLLPSDPALAGATVSASINGASDDDAQAALATTSAATGGPSAVGTASASADVRSGTLTAKTFGISDALPGGFLDADAIARIEEAVYLVPDQGSPVTPVPFTVFMDLAGILDVGGIGIAGSGNLQTVSSRASGSLSIQGFAVTGPSPAAITVTRLAQLALGTVLDDTTSVQIQQNASGLAEDGALDVRLTASAMVTPNSAFTVAASVSVESGAEANLESTAELVPAARLGVIVPDGYTMVSSSGLFLTVPEPDAPIAAALAALAALAVARCAA